PSHQNESKKESNIHLSNLESRKLLKFKSNESSGEISKTEQNQEFVNKNNKYSKKCIEKMMKNEEKTEITPQKRDSRPNMCLIFLILPNNLK
ncbi:MAG: hypothetical protein MHPSP_001250, partial [Paramarteilia canceri]